MNGARKFHSPDGPAFEPGQEWVGCSGHIRCWIVSTRRYGPNKWDVQVTYRYADGAQHDKDAWSFQVRYMHVADLEAR